MSQFLHFRLTSMVVFFRELHVRLVAGSSRRLPHAISPPFFPLLFFFPLSFYSTLTPYLHSGWRGPDLSRFQLSRGLLLTSSYPPLYYFGVRQDGVRYHGMHNRKRIFQLGGSMVTQASHSEHSCHSFFVVCPLSRHESAVLTKGSFLDVYLYTPMS